MRDYARQRAQCLVWNATRSHQVQAGKARAALMTVEERSRYGDASFEAFSVRMRAGVGLRQLFPEAAAKYLRVGDIRTLAGPLPDALQAIILHAYACGLPYGVGYWLDDPDGDDLVAVQAGSVFDTAAHEWQAWDDMGWSICRCCYRAGLCPGCSGPVEGMLSRLPVVLCARHG